MVQEGEQGAPVGGRMTTGQRIRMEGRAEGRMDGRLEQAQRTLLRILKRRFGSVAVLAEPRFQGASLLQLEGWIQRALDAPVLEAVFEDRFCTLFRVAFSLPQVAASWIRSLEASQRGPRVDWSTLGVIREVTLTTGLGLRLEQPVFEVQLCEGVGCVVFAPECQGASNRTAAESVRAFLCIAQEWRGEIGERLPALVPVLLRRDSLGVRTERPAHRVVAWHEETRRMLEVADPKSETWVDDLAGLTEQSLRARGLHPLATLVLLAYRFLPELGDAEASLEAFSRWQDLLEADMQGVGTQDVAAVLAALGRYMLEVTELAEPQLPRLLREPLDARTGVGMTTGDRIRLEVRKELWEQAVAFGRETQARTALVRLVERRFGADPSAIRAQLAGTSLQKLEVWLERVPEARTLSDLFDAE